MRVDALSILPQMFQSFCEQGVVGRAHVRGVWSLHCWNPRDYAEGAYRTVDDRPYGGGPGMVMLANPLEKALDAAKAAQRQSGCADAPVLLMSPQGVPLNQAKVASLAHLSAVTLVCGRYGGVDQRFIDSRVDEEISIGDFVVSGGELPAMLLLDAMVRLLPGVLNDSQSAIEESFVAGLLDHPHFTRPETLPDGRSIPAVLASGDHLRIARWRREQSLMRTAQRRPDLLSDAARAGRLDSWDRQFLLANCPGVVLD